MVNGTPGSGRHNFIEQKTKTKKSFETYLGFFLKILKYVRNENNV